MALVRSIGVAPTVSPLVARAHGGGRADQPQHDTGTHEQIAQFLTMRSNTGCVSVRDR
jgi:hypothetical protein